MGKHRLALGYLRRGIELEPSENLASLIRLQTARLFLRLAQPAEALRDLQLVQQMAPDEPSVHFLLGQAYAMSGASKRGEALKAYTNALSLDPSVSPSFPPLRAFTFPWAVKGLGESFD